MKPAIASSVFLVLRPKKNIINQNYLAWYFNHPETQKTLTGISKGSTIPSLSKKTLSEMIISLPGLELQEKIVEFEELRNKESKIKTRLYKPSKRINRQPTFKHHKMSTIKTKDINQTVWEACDTFRGIIDPSQYKDYILTMLFVKYVSDVNKEKRNQVFKKV